MNPTERKLPLTLDQVLVRNRSFLCADTNEHDSFINHYSNETLQFASTLNDKFQVQKIVKSILVIAVVRGSEDLYTKCLLMLDCDDEVSNGSLIMPVYTKDQEKKYIQDYDALLLSMGIDEVYMDQLIHKIELTNKLEKLIGNC